MLKRKDWGLFQGQDGSGSGSESGEAESEAEGSGSESEEAESEADGSESSTSSEGSEHEEAEELDIRRLEDLSEDDFEAAGTSDTPAKAVALKQLWLTASKDDAANLPRAALACRLCKGVLMLGPVSLRQHLESRKHLARLKRKADEYEPICFATGHEDDAKLETHTERLERMKTAALKPKGQNKPGTSRAARRREAKARKADSQTKKQGKPGKRQREELKASGKEGGARPRRLQVATKAKGGSQPQQQAAIVTQTSSFWSTPQPAQKKAKTSRADSQVPRKGEKPRKKLQKGKKDEAMHAANRSQRRQLQREKLEKFEARG